MRNSFSDCDNRCSVVCQRRTTLSCKSPAADVWQRSTTINWSSTVIACHAQGAKKASRPMSTYMRTEYLGVQAACGTSQENSWRCLLLWASAGARRSSISFPIVSPQSHELLVVSATHHFLLLAAIHANFAAFDEALVKALVHRDVGAPAGDVLGFIIPRNVNKDQLKRTSSSE